MLTKQQSLVAAFCNRTRRQDLLFLIRNTSDGSVLGGETQKFDLARTRSNVVRVVVFWNRCAVGEVAKGDARPQVRTFRRRGDAVLPLPSRVARQSPPDTGYARMQIKSRRLRMKSGDMSELTRLFDDERSPARLEHREAVAGRISYTGAGVNLGRRRANAYVKRGRRSHPNAHRNSASNMHRAKPRRNETTTYSEFAAIRVKAEDVLLTT